MHMNTRGLHDKVRDLMPYGAWYWTRLCYHALYARAVPLEKRLGPMFQREYEAQAERQWWNRAALLEYQSERLRQLIRHAYENVPFHRRRFDEHGVRPADIRDVRDLSRLPTMTKDDLRRHIDDLVATDCRPDRLIPYSTGGTSGHPVRFYMDQETVQFTLAHEWRQMNWMGYRFGERMATLRGQRVLRPGRAGGSAAWEHRPLDNSLVLSSYDLAPRHMTMYVAQLRRFKPRFLLGYASSLDELGRFMLEHQHAPLDGLIGTLTSSENVFDGQRLRIEKAFGAPLYDKFGNSEQTCIAGQCERRNGYHIFMDYGILEVLDGDGRQVDGERTIGEIVGTGFGNRAMPLIRYRTEDFAEHTDRCCDCGRHLPLLASICGRWHQEQIVAKGGNLISITALNSHSDVFNHVEHFQYVQEERGKVRLLVVTKPSFVPTEAGRILRELREKTRDQLDIELDVVSEIPRTVNGKYQFLIQKLPLRGSRRLDVR